MEISDEKLVLSNVFYKPLEKSVKTWLRDLSTGKSRLLSCGGSSMMTCITILEYCTVNIWCHGLIPFNVYPQYGNNGGDLGGTKVEEESPLLPPFLVPFDVPGSCTNVHTSQGSIFKFCLSTLLVTLVELLSDYENVIYAIGFISCILSQSPTHRATRIPQH